MDNGTMVETFKYLNYCQLATSSFVSKRFWNLIRTHRYKLPLLDVNEIFMNNYVSNRHITFIKLFNEELSPEKYNECVIRKGYSKLIPLDGQVAGKESTENCHDIYELWAYVYPNPNSYYHIPTSVFYAQTELKNETWPLFQHFVRLIMDPFIYIRTLDLITEKVVLSLLAGALNSDRDRVQCKHLNIRFNDDSQKFIVWIKHHVHCDEFQISVHSDLNSDEELLDLFLTGSRCTLAINVKFYDLSKVIVDLLKKFTGLKNRNEYQIVESTRGNVNNRGIVAELKLNFAKFVADEEQFEEISGTRQVIRFINNVVEMKLTFIVKNSSVGLPSFFSIKITNL